ncbi:hypothetical protein [Jatrophihabitans endophyticus]|uniref:hypothetical protein n=1 Tax=Jatrophihabitans endophyticus TaxID=1206085 RepID=UPI0019E0F8D0|nr:hypothetical protein [Jatrophihabitans endophyticus]MBE7187140.1 hypothetical protein [Jatrophihabitans endophyticus]
MPFRRRDRPDGDPAAAIRSAITSITTARDTATRNAAAALVNQGQVGRALALQRAELTRSLADVDAAVAAAQRVADDARTTDGAAAAAPYEQHVEGLHTQRDVLALALEQIDGLSDAAGAQVARARDLLVTSRRDLDAALHEQLRLLIAVERLERARAVEAARRAGGRPER